MRWSANQAADKIALIRDRKELKGLLSSYEAILADTTFPSHMFYRLRNASVDSITALAWLEKQLAKIGSTTEEATAAEHAYQAAGDVTMGNIIRALRWDGSASAASCTS